jgi:clan AA aspartic protease (TIGR02281 family)
LRRGVLLLCLIASVACAQTARATALDPSRLAAIDQAATQFSARVAEAHKSGGVPRQSDPAVGELLDTVFGTSDLSHGALPYGDLGKLSDWLGRVVEIGRVYLSASRAVHDFGVFAPELGRFFDASVALEQAIADCTMAELDAHPGANLSPADQAKLAQLRGALGGALNESIGLFREPGISVDWALQRLSALRAAAPSLARFLTPAEIAQLRATLLRLDAQVHGKPLREAFAGVAVALAAPAPPVPPPAETAGAEIALESDGHGDFTVPVRINGAEPVKFVVDSGAGVVVLPADLVETLTKSGAIGPGDMLGRDIYVTADGHKHHGTRLMLHQLDVGGHTVTDVMASVAPARATPLLGQSFLAKFKSWTLDNQRHILIISE